MMMQELNYPTNEKWFIVYNDEYHSYGYISNEQCMQSGLDYLELFDSENLMIDRLKELFAEDV